MSKGVVLIANNNGHIDYVKQAVFLSHRVKQYLNLPVTVITDSPNYLKNNFDTDHLDQIITIDYKETTNKRFYFDGAMSHKTLQFKNQSRTLCYFLSPYDKTLVMDTDYIICNDVLLKCFDSNSDLMLYRKSYDISNIRDTHEFKYVSDQSIIFYWATVLYFTKNSKNDAFFGLIDHIQEEWHHYRKTYQISNSMFRNDFAFSIALHIMRGFENSTEIADELPGKHFYTADKDILWKLNDDKMMFLVEKKDYVGEYTPVSTQGMNVHVMNKFSLERCMGNVK